MIINFNFVNYRKMSTRVRATLYSRGTICTNENGYYFQCERPKLILLPPSITFERLKGVIREKLRLSPHEHITSVVYRQPECVLNSSVKYGIFYIEGDDDMEAMLDLHSAFALQLPSLELYVDVTETSIDLNTDMTQTSIDLNTEMVPIMDNIGGCSMDPVENFASSSVYRSMVDLPSSSHQTIDSDTDDPDYNPSPLRSSEPSEEGSELGLYDEDCLNYDVFEANTTFNLNFVHSDDDEADAIPARLTRSRANQPTMAREDQPTGSQPTGSREHQPMAFNFYNEINVRAASDPEPFDATDPDQDLRIGTVFPTKNEFKRAVKMFSIRSGRDYTVFKSGAKAEEYRCTHYLKAPHECPWRIRAAVLKDTSHWTVTRLGNSHTCVVPRPEHDKKKDHRKLDSDIIASHIVGLVSDHPKTSGPQIQQVMYSQFKYHVSYNKAWRAKYKALKIAFGDWESSYALLPIFLQAAFRAMPGTIYEFDVKPLPLDPTSAQFHRVFWAFRPCIDAFPHLKPIVQVDGTWLYGKYKQTLLIACSQDGDRKIVPLAFAIVEGETCAAWKFFLTRLREHVIGTRQGVCLISDRGDGCIEAVKDPACGWQPPLAHHVFCVRHLVSNVRTRFGKKDGKKDNKWLKKAVQDIGMLY